MRDLFQNIYKYRFQFFLLTQLLILFGSIITPIEFYENIFSPLFYIINLLAGFYIVSKHRFLSLLVKTIIGILLLDLLISIAYDLDSKWNQYLRFFSYFIFYVVVSFELIKQVWKANDIDSSVIFGLISGYVSLGLIGFFIFYTIEIIYPNSYSGLAESGDFLFQTKTAELLYFSFVTLLTIGYGEIIPILPVSQKAAIMIGLMGQLYLVIITSIVVGKYLNQYHIKKQN